MLLPEEQAARFHRLYGMLLAFANRQLGVFPEHAGAGDGKPADLTKMRGIRDALWEHPEVIESFTSENRLKLPPEDTELVSSWKHAVAGKFIAFRQLKKHAVFLTTSSPTLAYAVLGLYSTLEEMLPTPLPAMVQTVLLPFEGQIVHDGLIAAHPIQFGSGFRQSMAQAYEEAKATDGLITSLPFVPKQSEPNNEDLLRFYLKSEANRERYSDEIVDLIESDHSLLRLYYQEIGRLNSRGIKRRMRGMKLSRGWFAVLGEDVVAGATTRDELEDILDRLLPENRREFVHIFKLSER